MTTDADIAVQGWERWWASLETHDLLDEDGFLREATDWRLNRTKRAFWRLDELDDVPCIVMLGESGIGKSHELKRLESRLRTGNPLTRWLRFASFGPVSEDRQRGGLTFERILGGAELEGWRRGHGVFPLLLDALDESPYTPERAADLLLDLLRTDGADLNRLRLRLTGRTAVWSPRLEDSLTQVFGSGGMRVVQLLPLRFSQVLDHLTRSGGRAPEAVADGLRAKGLGPLAARPLTLKLLSPVLREGPDVLRETPMAKLYDAALRRRYGESIATRCVAQEQGRRVAQMYATANRLGAATVLGGLLSFSEVPGLTFGDGGAVSARALLGGSEVVDEESVPVNDEGLDDLRTAIFTLDGGGLRWEHASFAEFHAAQWVLGHTRTSEARLRWLTGEDGSLDALPAGVEAVAALIATEDRAAFDRLVETAPLVLLRCDRAMIDDGTRARLVAAILARAEEVGSAFSRWCRLFQGMDGEKVRDVLGGCLRDPSSAPETKALALSIAQINEISSLAPAAVEIALKLEGSLRWRWVRERAASFVAEHGDRETRAALLPLLREGGDLRWYTLRALWRRDLEQDSVISIREMLSLLVEGGDAHEDEADRWFPNVHLEDTIRDEEVSVALAWATERVRGLHEGEPRRQAWFELCASLLVRAWRSRPPGWDVAPLVELLDVYASWAHDLPRAFVERVLADAETDRGFLIALVERFCEGRAKSWMIQPLVLRESLDWLLARAESSESVPVGRAWGDFALAKLRAVEGEDLSGDESRARHRAALDVFFSARERSSTLRDATEWYFGGISLDGEWVRHEREFAQTRLRRAREEKKTADQIRERIDEELGRLDSTPADSFWRLMYWLRTRPAGHARVTVALHGRVTETSWWREANAASRARVLRAAERFLGEGDPDAASWYGKQLADHRAEAGRMALVLLFESDPEAPPRIPTGVWARWMPVLVDALRPEGEEGRLHEAIVRRAAAAVPDVFAEWVDREIDVELRAHGHAAVLYRVPIEGDRGLARRLLERLEGPIPLSEVSAFLVRARVALPREADARACEILATRTAGDPTQRERAVYAAVYLLRHAEDHGWERVWPALQEDTAFGRAVVERLGAGFHLADRVPVRLPVRALGAWWRWLATQWPYQAFARGPRPVIVGEEVRDAVLREIERRAETAEEADDTVSVLRQIADENRALVWLRPLVVSAEREVKARRWRPWPSSIFKAPPST